MYSSRLPIGLCIIYARIMYSLLVTPMHVLRGGPRLWIERNDDWPRGGKYEPIRSKQIRPEWVLYRVDRIFDVVGKRLVQCPSRVRARARSIASGRIHFWLLRCRQMIRARRNVQRQRRRAPSRCQGASRTESKSRNQDSRSANANERRECERKARGHAHASRNVELQLGEEDAELRPPTGRDRERERGRAWKTKVVGDGELCACVGVTLRVSVGVSYTW